MRVKLVPLAILLSTTMYGGFITAQQAHAETIRPQGSWAVSKVAAKQQGATPYCALSRRFGNGSVLTFARNGMNESSVAVDLPKSSFETDQTYTVMFDTRPSATVMGESRSYETKPVSERGIVIRMGQDEKFYNALEQSGQLSISVNNQSYVFAMPDVKNGTQDLAACLGVQVEPAAGNQAGLEARMSDDLNADLLAAEESVMAPAAKKAKGKKTSVLTPEPAGDIAAKAPASVNSGLLQNLQEENIRLKNALERERRVYEDKMQQSGNVSTVAELNEKMRLLEIENRTLREQAQPASLSAASAQPSTCLADHKGAAEIAALKDENSRLKMDIESRQQQIAALEASQNAGQKPGVTPVAQAGKDMVALEKRAGDAEMQLAGLRDQLGRLQAENAALRKTASASPATDASSAEALKGGVATITKMKALEVQLSDMRAERDRLSQELASLKSADADGRIKISSDNWNLEQATRRFNEAELEIRRLGMTLEQERAKCAVEKKDLEYMLFDPKIAEKQQIAKLISLENELAQANQVLQAAKDGDQSRLAAFETRVRELEGQISADKQKMASAESRAAALEQQLSVKETEIAALRQKRDSTGRSESQAAEQLAMIGALQQEVASLNGQVANLQSEKSGMAEKLAQISTSSGGHAVNRVAGRVSGAPETVSKAVDVARVDYGAVAYGGPVPVTPQPLEASVPVAALSQAAAVNPRMMKPADIESMLQRAGIAVSGKIQPVSLTGEAGRIAYRWETGGLFGTAEQKMIESTAQFDRFVGDYLNQTKSRCTGQFASIPALDEVAGPNRMAAYEIACVDDAGAGASAALVFESRNGVFTTIAHESAPESMDLAMDARDKIISALQNGKTASR